MCSPAKIRRASRLKVSGAPEGASSTTTPSRAGLDQGFLVRPGAALGAVRAGVQSWLLLLAPRRLGADARGPRGKKITIKTLYRSKTE